MSTIFLVGGLPGSGKTTIATTLYHGLQADHDAQALVSADDFFYLSEGEEICSEAVRADPSLISGSDLLRSRVGRSVRHPSEHPPWRYRFDREVQGHAHVWCVEQVRNELARQTSTGIVVHNTFTQRWEMEPYFRLAEHFGARIHVLRLYDGGCSDAELAYRNSHGVPLEVIQQFRENWETDWRNGDPTPPWERPDVE